MTASKKFPSNTWSSLNANWGSFCQIGSQVIQYQNALSGMASNFSANYQALKNCIGACNTIEQSSGFSSDPFFTVLNNALSLSNYSQVQFSTRQPKYHSGNIGYVYPYPLLTGMIPANTDPIPMNLTCVQSDVKPYATGMSQLLAYAQGAGIPWWPSYGWVKSPSVNVLGNANNPNGLTFNYGALKFTVAYNNPQNFANDSSGTITVSGTIPQSCAFPVNMVTSNPNFTALVATYF